MKKNEKKTDCDSLYFRDLESLQKRNRFLSYIIVGLIIWSMIEGYIIYTQLEMYNNKKTKAYAISDDGRSFMLSEKIDSYRGNSEISRFSRLFVTLLYNVSWRDFENERIQDGTSYFNNVLAMSSPSLRTKIMKTFNDQSNGESFITFLQKHKTGMTCEIISEHVIDVKNEPFKMEFLITTQIKGIPETKRKLLIKLVINKIPRSNKNEISRAGLEITDYDEIVVKN